MLKLFVFSFIVVLSFHSTQSVQFKRRYICYLGDEDLTGNYVDHIYYPYFIDTYVPVELCTHVIHAFIYPEEGGTFSIQTEVDIHVRNGSASSNVKRTNKKIKYMVSLLGSASKYQIFYKIITDDQQRNLLILELQNMLDNGKIDGIDIHWIRTSEWSGTIFNETAKEGFHKFLTELRAALPKKIISVSISNVNGYIEANAYNISHILRNTNYINVLAFDYHTYRDGVTGFHSPLFSIAPSTKSIDMLVRYLLTNFQIPRHKLVVGISGQAQTFSLVNKNQNDLGAQVNGHAPNWRNSLTRNTEVYEPAEVCGINEVIKNVKSKNDFEHRSSYFTYQDTRNGKNVEVWFSHYLPENMYDRGLFVASLRLGGVSVFTFSGFAPVGATDYSPSKCCLDLELWEALDVGLRTCPVKAAEEVQKHSKNVPKRKTI